MRNDIGVVKVSSSDKFPMSKFPDKGFNLWHNREFPNTIPSFPKILGRAIRSEASIDRRNNGCTMITRTPNPVII